MRLRHLMGTATFGQEWSFRFADPNVGFQIRNPTFEPIAAAQSDLFVGYVGFTISKRKQLVGANFVAC